jgi:hypothetical protein
VAVVILPQALVFILHLHHQLPHQPHLRKQTVAVMIPAIVEDIVQMETAENVKNNAVVAQKIVVEEESRQRQAEGVVLPLGDFG